jgi:hypothetical protein
MSHIYVLSNPAFPEKKIGKSSNIMSRKSSYTTYAPDAWICDALVSCPKNSHTMVENYIKEVLFKYNVRRGGGTEFYDINDDQVEIFIETLIHKFPECCKIEDFDPITCKANNSLDESIENDHYDLEVIEPILMATEYFDEYDNLDGYEIPWPIVKFVIEKFNLKPPKYKIDIKNHCGEDIYGYAWGCFTKPVDDMTKRKEFFDKVLRNCEGMSEHAYKNAEYSMYKFLNN